MGLKDTHRDITNNGVSLRCYLAWLPPERCFLVALRRSPDGMKVTSLSPDKLGAYLMGTCLLSGVKVLASVGVTKHNQKTKLSAWLDTTRGQGEVCFLVL